MNYIVKNWKTSVPAVVTGIINLLPYFGVAISPAVTGGITTLTVFLIGIFAKDGNVSGTGEATK